MLMPGRHYNADKYRFGFNGMEKDDEVKGVGNSYDFGARIYDPRVGRWLACDPLSKDYPDLSSYNFVGNMPINAIDPDGKKIVFPNKSQATVVVNDLNSIFEEKYGVSGAFKVTKRVTKYKVRTNDWSLADPSTWGNIFEDPKYEEKEIVDYEVSKSENFHKIKSDKYTKAISEVIDSKVVAKGRIVKDEFERYGQKYSVLEDSGGGEVKSSTSFILSEKLSRRGEEGTTGKFKSKWTFGGVTLHEVIYHLHRLGRRESGKTDEDGNRGANQMRKYYKLKTGRDHPAGDKAIIGL